MADDPGLAPKESVIETLCSWPDGLAVGGFRVSTRIPRVRLRRGRSFTFARAWMRPLCLMKPSLRKMVGIQPRLVNLKWGKTAASQAQVGYPPHLAIFVRIRTRYTDC